MKVLYIFEKYTILAGIESLTHKELWEKEVEGGDSREGGGEGKHKVNFGSMGKQSGSGKGRYR